MVAVLTMPTSAAAKAQTFNISDRLNSGTWVVNTTTYPTPII
jgi:hypothetical protein